ETRPRYFSLRAGPSLRRTRLAAAERVDARSGPKRVVQSRGFVYLVKLAQQDLSHLRNKQPGSKPGKRKNSITRRNRTHCCLQDNDHIRSRRFRKGKTSPGLQWREIVSPATSASLNRCLSRARPVAIAPSASLTNTNTRGDFQKNERFDRRPVL